jgi:hypothetical protein
MPTLTRRESLLSSAVVAGAVSPGTAADIPDKVKIYQRARGAPKGQMALHWYSGRYWGKRAMQAAIQFFRVDGFSFNKMVLNADGSLSQDMVEVGFWLDPVGGFLLDDWTNPYNGLSCRPQHYKSAQSMTFGPDGRAVRNGATPPGMKFAGKITEPVVQGDTVWIGEDLIVEAIRPPPEPKPNQPVDPSTVLPPIMTATSLVTYTMKASDLRKSDNTWLPSTMNYQTMGNWYPWMRMGYETGQCMFQLTGCKLRSLDEIPPALRGLIEQRHPGFLKDPGI